MPQALCSPCQKYCIGSGHPQLRAKATPQAFFFFRESYCIVMNAVVFVPTRYRRRPFPGRRDCIFTKTHQLRAKAMPQALYPISKIAFSMKTVYAAPRRCRRRFFPIRNNAFLMNTSNFRPWRCHRRFSSSEIAHSL